MPLSEPATHAASQQAGADRRMDFFVIGAQKSATSWLFYCLREHPEISLPREKREIYYLGGPEVQRRGANWFFEQYAPDAGRQRGSVSVDYLYDATALRQVLRDYPTARLIALLRNPFERTASAHGWLSRKGLLGSGAIDLGIKQSIAECKGGDVGSVLAQLVLRSLYGAQLQPVFDAEAQDRLLVVDYDQLCTAPETALKRIYRFVGVAPEFVPPSLSRRPKRDANLGWLTFLERLAPRARWMGKVMDHANQWVSRWGFARPRQPIVGETRAMLREQLASDMAVLKHQLSQLPQDNFSGDRNMVSRWGF